MGIGLHDEHHRPQVLRPRNREGVLDPGDVCLAARTKLRTAKIVAVTGNIEAGEYNPSVDPTNVFPEQAELRAHALPDECHRLLAQRLIALRKYRAELLQPLQWIEGIGLHPATVCPFVVPKQ